ncbi:GntR family transcriptional regulator [Actinotignum urinale]|uniref:GntR family transcriptional regulator n=1 Tax=Actinotignum urinale TaxID=190146 RepID=UPI00370D2C6E
MRARASLRDEIYQDILDLLLGGAYQPGEVVNIDALSRTLDVSPTPIREALVELEHTSLVERTARRGYRVASPLSGKQIKDLMEVRTILELQALKRAYPTVDSWIDELTLAHDEHVKAFEYLPRAEKSQEYSAIRHYFEADWHFHSIIFENAGNEYLSKVLEGLAFQMHRLRQTVGHGKSDGADATCEHSKILHALQERNEKASKLAVKSHLNKVLKRSVADS